MVVCADLSPESWKRIQHALQDLPGLTLLRCPAVAADVLSVCSRLGPSVLIAERDFIRQFDSEELLELSRSGRLQVLALVPEVLSDDYVNLLRSGCAGVIEEDIAPDVLRRAVVSVGVGQMWAPRLVLSQLARESLLADSPRRLTPRENEILRLLARSYRNQQIADHLFISRETVRWHLRSLYSKIGVSDRNSAVEYARRATESTRT
jgi:DNA-binding NarL/FixJ family response regulator